MKKTIVVSMLLALAAAPALPAEDGTALFKSKCAMCHGPDGKGQTPVGRSMKARDLGSPEVQQQTDAELVKIIVDGKGNMPPYKGKLTDAEISAVVAFIRALKK
jgi:mono/diheme cytochrome c family protein